VNCFRTDSAPLSYPLSSVQESVSEATPRPETADDNSATDSPARGGIPKTWEDSRIPVWSTGDPGPAQQTRRTTRPLARHSEGRVGSPSSSTTRRLPAIPVFDRQREMRRCVRQWHSQSCL